jgi:hypothetical protein
MQQATDFIGFISPGAGLCPVASRYFCYTQRAATPI